MNPMALMVVGCSAPYEEALSRRLIDRGLLGSISGDGPNVVLVHCISEQNWARLESEIESGSIVIAVLPEPILEEYVHALALGASGVVPFNTSSLITAAVIEAATHGEVLLPRHAAHSISVLAQRLTPKTDLSADDAELLKAISAGHTIVEIARQSYFSERTVRRHLQSLYMKLGVRNRAEAISAATRMGMID